MKSGMDATLAVTLGRDTVQTVEEVEVRCPVCGEHLDRHFVTKWYSRRYDIWSGKMAQLGLSCFVVRLARYPNARADARTPASRGRPKGAREGRDFIDPSLAARGTANLRSQRKVRR